MRLCALSLPANCHSQGRPPTYRAPLSSKSLANFYLQYSHAILEHWGRGERLLLGDVDEYVASDQPTTISNILSCTGWPDQAHITRFDVMCSEDVCPGDGETEAKVWESPERYPLQHYGLMNRQKWSIRPPKVVVSPETVRHFFVHDGLVVPGGQDAPVPPKCGYIVHPRSLYSKRSNKTDFSHDVSWHWLFEKTL